MVNIKYEKFGRPEEERLYSFVTRHLADTSHNGQLEDVESQLDTHRHALASLLELMANKKVISATELVDILSAYAPCARLTEDSPK